MVLVWQIAGDLSNLPNFSTIQYMCSFSALHVSNLVFYCHRSFLIINSNTLHCHTSNSYQWWVMIKSSLFFATDFIPYSVHMYIRTLIIVLDELVAKVLQVVEKLMDASQELLDAWSTHELVSAIHEASSLARLSPVV